TTNFVTTLIDEPSTILEENTIYPNPTKGKISIKLNEIQSVDIMSLQGKIIKSKTNIHKGSEIDLSNLTNGIYFLRIKAENKVYYSKVLKY
ncbi:MAG: hypothetical protein DRI95_13445, partial [Bacteroidetes bacterium]